MNVAKFLDQSTLHSTRLQEAFKALATVKVYSYQRLVDRKLIEHHLRALLINIMWLLMFFAILIFRSHSQDSDGKHMAVSRSAFKIMILYYSA